MVGYISESAIERSVDMALFPANKSGIPEGDILWTNSAPTSSIGAGYVTLSQSISNYDYLKITARLNTSNTKNISILISVDDFKNKSGFTANSLNPAIFCYYASSGTRGRQFAYGSDTSFGMGQAINMGDGIADNTWLIPIEIRGIK